MELNLNLPSNVKVESERDSVGGHVLDSNVYSGTIELAYLDYAASGAISINVHFKTLGKVIKQTTYISNKAGEFTYADKNDNKPKPLPGYTEMSAFFQAVTGKSIAEQETEDKQVKVWNSEQKSELPKKVKVFSNCTGQDIAIGILKISEEKTAKSDRGYVGTGEFRDINKFDKYFDATTGLTNVEKSAGEKEPAFLTKWKDTNKDKVRISKAKISGVPAGATTGSPSQSSGGATKLFTNT